LRTALPLRSVKRMGLISNWLAKTALLGALGRILPLELALIAAYDRAISRIGVPGTADQLAQFRNEHARHVEELLDISPALARRLAPELRAKLASRHSGWEGGVATDHTEEALQEVLLAERRARIAWGRFRSKAPDDTLGMVHRFSADEERHLRFVENLIAARVWEQFDTLEQP
jgi:hypothetical protein